MRKGQDADILGYFSGKKMPDRGKRTIAAEDVK
jgi:hypothetical protein